jgi:predicted XRE-type DNA-binding protein
MPLYGIENGNSKLDGGEVIKIGKLYHRERLSQREIANRFYVTQSTISGIVRGRTWGGLGSKENIDSLP